MLVTAQKVRLDAALIGLAATEGNGSAKVHHENAALDECNFGSTDRALKLPNRQSKPNGHPRVL